MLKLIIKESKPQDYQTGIAFLNQYNKKLLARGHNITNLKYLGSGYNGHAYQMTNGRVFKLTYDETEAMASRVVMGEGTTYIVNVYDVFKFSKSAAFGIVMEKLEESDQEEKAFWDTMADLDIINNATSDFNGPVRWKDLYPLIKKDLSDPNVMSAEEAKLYLANMQKYNLPEMINELYKYGIIFEDFHGDNIMKRKGVSVIIDLGYSEVQKAKEMPVIEMKNKPLVAR